MKKIIELARGNLDSNNPYFARIMELEREYREMGEHFFFKHLQKEIDKEKKSNPVDNDE